MAASSLPQATASGDSSSTSEIREGFLCPICMCDLGTLAQLSVHFDTAHSGEDRDALQSLKELFGNMKKKIKIKAGAEGGGGELSEAGSISEADSSLKDDLPEWEEQILGHTRSHTSAFKALRDERNSHAAIQRNKLVIRLKKLVDSSAPVDPQRRKDFEKSLVRWAPDEDVPLCPFCAATLGPPGGFGQTLKNLAKSNDVGDTPAVKLKELKDKFKLKQILGSRRHHCRTCGAVMCHDCSFFISFTMAERVVNVINEGNEVGDTPTIESRKPLEKGVRRSGSNSSLDSMAAFEGEMYVRICRDCWTNLESRFHYLETLHALHPTSHLYRVLMRSLQEIEVECPVYVEMAQALHRGEQTCELEEAQRKRNRLMKLCEGVDQVSKKILVSGKQPANAVEGQMAATTTGGPSEKQLKLQRVIRQMAANFLQDHVFGLQSLPSSDDYERLKEKRQKELLREIEAQRQAELEAKRLAAKMEEVDDSCSKRPTELSVGDKQTTKEGWLPTQVRADDAEDDPLLQQISIIKGYIAQAKQAGKMDEVKMLTENLKDLQMVVKKERDERRRKEEERRRAQMEREEERRKTEVGENTGNDSKHQDREEEYPDTLNPFAEDE